MGRPELKRELGLASAVMITVGGVIGSGIFMKPLDVSRALPDATTIYLCWAGIGLVCLAGALAYGELSTMIPEAGGQYAYLREAFGPLAAFLYGWTFFLVINSGTAAALAVAFAKAIAQLVPLSQGAIIATAMAMIVGLAAINHFGVRFGAWFQNVSTAAKVAALGAIIVGGLLHRGSSEASMIATTAAPALATAGIVQACVSMFWAYEGWHQLSFSAAELKRPDRDLSRGFVWGILLLIILYLAVNAVYLGIIPLGEMRGLGSEVLVPKLTLDRLFGEGAGTAFAALLALSIVGASNTNYMSSPRAFYAMAEDGLFFTAQARIHPRWRTPAVAIWTQAALAALIVLWLQNFKDITEYVVFAALLFYALTVAGVYRLRSKWPDRPRTFRCPGYPITPAVFIAGALFVDFNVLLDEENRLNALYGLLLISTGIPLYFAVFRARRKAHVESERLRSL